MSYNPKNANGQATMANSEPVVIASDQSAVPITVASVPSHAVTNAGTFATQATLQTQTDTVMVGGVNVKEINAVAPLMGNGTTGTGSLRVTLASDTTANSNPFLITGTKTNNNAAPAATQLGVMPAVANASVQTWTEGDQVLESVDLSGNQRATLGTLISGEDQTVGVMKVEQRFSYSAISTATTTTVKSGAGFLHTITVTGGTAGTIAITDNTTSGGTSIAAFSSTNAIATYTLDVSFSTGLTIVTGAATTLTVSYR